MIKSKFRTLRRGVCALLAVVMCLSMASVSAFAATTKTLSDTESGFSFSMESDDTTKTMKSVSVDVKTAAEGLHDFTEASNVGNYLAYMHGDNGMSMQINFLDSDGNQVDYSGDVTVSYKLPGDWDLNNGVKVVTVSDSSLGTMTYSIGAVADSYTTGRTVKFTFSFDNTSTNATRFLIMQNLAKCNVEDLEDGVYDVNLEMLKDVENESLSMASQTVSREAKLIKKDGKVYLNVNFNMGVVMFSPAFCNKVYSIDLTKGDGNVPTYDECISGTVLSYYDNEEALQFSFDTMKNGLHGALGYTDEQIQNVVDTCILQNGIKAIHNVTLDVTNSLQDDGSFLVGFCSDTMDTLYKGTYGSDAGYNTTNFFVGNPVASNEDADQYLVTNACDKSQLEEVFEQYIEICHPNNIYRMGYTTDSYNNYFVPAWQEVYQAYSYVDATQEQIDQAVTDGEAALEKLEKVKVGELTKYTSTYQMNFQKLLDTVNAVDSTLYTTESYENMMSYVPALQEQVDLDTEAYIVDASAAYLNLNDAYNALELKATDYTALETAINNVKDTDLSGYTADSAEAFTTELANAQAMLEAQDSSDSEIDAQITALNEAFANLTEKVRLADGTYTVNVSMVKADRETPSMANGAINPQAKLEVVDGEYYVTLDFQGMTISGSLGYMSSLSYYDEGFTYDENGTPVGTLVAAEVLGTQKNDDGTDVVDVYNKDTGALYPDLVKIKLSSTTVNDDEGLAPVQVTVPVMEAISKDLGNQNVLLKLDWTSVTEGYTEPATEPTADPTTPDEPATDDPTDPATPDEPATEPTTPDDEDVLLGDVNGDGRVDISDATEVQKAVAQIINLTDEQIKAANVDGDDVISVQDATAIQKYIAHIITVFPAEE